jgi:O-antigen/teichoic acid export membrane protein
MHSFHALLVNVIYSKLGRASSWLILGSIAAGVLGFVFQVLMGRILSLQEYGLFSAIIALVATFSAPLGTLQMVISRRVSEYRARMDKGCITHLYFSINIYAIVVTAIIFCSCYFISPQVQMYLKTSSPTPILLLSLILFFTSPATINYAFLQGLQKFNWLSLSGALGGFLKITLAATLVWLGYGIEGALSGIILALFLGWLVTFIALISSLKEGLDVQYEMTHISFKSSLPVLIANCAFAAMTQLDIVFVNYYFPSHEASLYAAASIMGKAVMYLPGGIVMAMFPMVAEHHTRNEDSTYLLLQAVKLTTLLCCIGAFCYFFMGEWIISLLYGERYYGAGEILKYYGFAILPMGLVMVAEYFLIAKGQVLFAYLFAFVMPLQLIAIYFYHSSLINILFVIGTSSTLLALIGYAVLWRAYRK